MSVTTRDITNHTIYDSSGVTSGFNSSSINRDVMDGYCILANITFNTTTGSVILNLEASLDDVTYVDIANSTSTVSASGQVMWNATDQNYSFVRVSATMTSANISAVITGRAVRK